MEKINIGIDLGTTNTVVTAFVNGKLQPLRLFENNEGILDAIIPSVILKFQSASKSTLAGVSPERTRIGYAALAYFIDIYENQETSKLDKYKIHSEYKRTIAKDIESVNLTTLMLDLILEKISVANASNNIFENLVITVPHIWKPESLERQKTLSAIQACKTKFKKLQLLSEPIAAAVYFAYKRPNKIKENILVCDLGGGTQDFTLCTLSAQAEIEVIDNEGSNESGGAKIDDFLAAEIEKQISFSLNSHDKYYLKLEAEKVKRRFNKSLEFEIQEQTNESYLEKIWGKLKSTITKYFSYTLDILLKQKSIEFSVQNQKVQINPKHIESATNTILPILEKHLSNLIARNKNLSIDKCILVGGSSNNIFLQAKIRDIIDTEIITFNAEDRYMAISYGASLVAANKIKITERTSFNYGIMIRNKGESRPHLILPKNTPFGTKVICDDVFKPLENSKSKTSIVCWESEKDYFSIGESFEINNSSNEIKYAMKVDSNGILCVECLDSRNQLLNRKEYQNLSDKLSEEDISQLIQPLYADLEILKTIDKNKLVDQFEINIHGKNVLLYNGDITWLNVDAIVSSDNSNRQMGTGVSLAIKTKGGIEILRELQEKKIPNLNIVVTKAGKLHAKSIFHAIIHNASTGKIEDPYILTETCIQVAEELGFHSIAIPIFGTGGLGFDFKITSKKIFTALREVLPQAKNVKLVVISVPLNQNFKVFKDLFE